MSGPRRAAAVALLLLPLVVSGCSIPTWVPLLGKSKRGGAGGGAQGRRPPASAPILTSRDQLHDSEDVVDRVICVVNNDAITQYELDEAELYYLAETRERPADGEARKLLRDPAAAEPDREPDPAPAGRAGKGRDRGRGARRGHRRHP